LPYAWFTWTRLVDFNRSNSKYSVPQNVKTTKRKVLVILSNRLNRLQKVRFVELDCDDKGNIFKESALRKQPRKAIYAEVWENDDGKTVISSCTRFKRKYGHPLQKPKG
jgi:hypothetical protein